MDKSLLIASSQSSYARRSIVKELTPVDSLTFGELMKAIDIDQGRLAYHLRKLMGAGVVTNYYDKRPHRRGHSYYALTPGARDVLEQLSPSPDVPDGPNRQPDFISRTRTTIRLKGGKNGAGEGNGRDGFLERSMGTAVVSIRDCSADKWTVTKDFTIRRQSMFRSPPIRIVIRPVHTASAFTNAKTDSEKKKR